MNFDRMRALLLEQAVQGKLVPQLEDEPAVEQIGEAPNVVPFLIPKTWKWVRLNNLTTIVRGGSPRPIQAFLTDREDGLNWVKIGDAERGSMHINQCAEKIIPAGLKKTRFIRKGSLLLTNSMSFGYPYILDVDGCIHDGWLAFSDFEEFSTKEYLYYVLLSPYCRGAFVEKAAGAVVKNLNIDKVKQVYVPIPPLAEQHQIVGKLEEYFAEIDRAEKAYQELQTLTDVLRKKILQEAVMGKLVPQLDGEPAVEQIGDAPEIIPFEIPKKWKWVRLSAVGEIVGGGTPKTGVSEYWDGDISWITPADLGKNSNQTIYSGAKLITKKGLDKSSAKLMPKGSIVYSSRAPIGHIAVAGKELCTNQGCKSFVPETKFISTEWAYYMLIARTRDIQSRASGTTFKEISGKGMGETWISLPPLPEQRRIVAKVEELMAQVDRLAT